MWVLNFTHPLTGAQRSEVEHRTGQSIERLIEVPTQLDHGRSFAEQVVELVETAGLTPGEWQGEPILIVPPALSAVAVTLLAELHGRMGYFAPIVRIGPVDGSLPPRYEVFEVINLQAVRNKARAKR